jgi:hypothetical protein
MSQETAAPRLRLNDDVWRHTAAILGDTQALCALEAVSRELLTLVRKPRQVREIYAAGGCSGGGRSPGALNTRGTRLFACRGEEVTRGRSPSPRRA